MDKINCGGFYLGEGLSLEGNVLNATGGGSDSGMMVVNVTDIQYEEETTIITLDTPVADIFNAFPKVCINNPLSEVNNTFLPHYSYLDETVSVAEFYTFAFTDNSMLLATIQVISSIDGEEITGQETEYNFVSELK